MPTFKLSKTERKTIMAAVKRIEVPATVLKAAVETYDEAVSHRTIHR